MEAFGTKRTLSFHVYTEQTDRVLLMRERFYV